MVYGGNTVNNQNQKTPNFRDKAKLEKEAALSKQEPVNQITIEYLRNQAKMLDEMATSMGEEAGKTGDPELWDAARVTRGQASMCRDLIQYIKGLTYREYLYQLRAEKL